VSTSNLPWFLVPDVRLVLNWVATAVVSLVNACPRTQSSLIPCLRLVHIGRYGAARTQSFCAPVIIKSRRCPLCTTSRGTCLTTYFGTSVRVHNSDWRCDTISPLSQRRTSYVLRRDSHGRRIGILSDAGQLCPGVCVCRP
jgi:hypothetical protein